MSLWKKKPAKPEYDMRSTWKVVHLDGPLPDEVGLPSKFGVIISTDEMLAKTQTLLFCPLLDGVDNSKLRAVMPWHVEVEIEQKGDDAYAQLGWDRILVSTKIVLPTTLNEVDRDGLQRGYLAAASRRRVAAKLVDWFPPFKRIADGR